MPASRPPRVLLVLHSFVPWSRYGTELYTYNLAVELRRLEVPVHILYTEPGQTAVRQTEWDGLPCTVVPRRQRSGPAQLDESDPASEVAFEHVLNEFRPDVVHFCHLMHLSFRLPSMAAAFGAGTVYTLHDFWLGCPKVKLFDWWGRRCHDATRWKCASCSRARFSRMTWPSIRVPASGGSASSGAIKEKAKDVVFQMTERPLAWQRIRQRDAEVAAMVENIDCFIAPAAFVATRMAPFGIPQERTVVCDYAIPETNWRPVRLEDKPATPRFGYIGGITIEKGLGVLLDAFRGFEGADLVIYGADIARVRQELPQYSDVLSQPNVTAGGFLDEVQKGQALPLLHALIVPSTWEETGPLVVYEAFEAGVPVIAANVGGQAARVKDNVNGLLFEAGNASSLRSIIEGCLGDPSLLPRLTANVTPPPAFSAHARDLILPIYERVRKGESRVRSPTRRTSP